MWLYTSLNLAHLPFRCVFMFAAARSIPSAAASQNKSVHPLNPGLHVKVVKRYLLPSYPANPFAPSALSKGRTAESLIYLSINIVVPAHPRVKHIWCNKRKTCTPRNSDPRTQTTFTTGCIEKTAYVCKIEGFLFKKLGTVFKSSRFRNTSCDLLFFMVIIRTTKRLHCTCTKSYSRFISL